VSVAPESIVCTAEIGSGDHLLLPTCMKMESGLPVIFIAIFTERFHLFIRDILCGILQITVLFH
jgi:hypothetical protein